MKHAFVSQFDLPLASHLWSIASTAVRTCAVPPTGETQNTKSVQSVGGPSAGSSINGRQLAETRRIAMKVWTKPAVREQEVGLEVTSYLPAEIDII